MEKNDNSTMGLNEPSYLSKYPKATAEQAKAYAERLLSKPAPGDLEKLQEAFMDMPALLLEYMEKSGTRYIFTPKESDMLLEPGPNEYQREKKKIKISRSSSKHEVFLTTGIALDHELMKAPVHWDDARNTYSSRKWGMNESSAEFSDLFSKHLIPSLRLAYKDRIPHSMDFADSLFGGVMGLVEQEIERKKKIRYPELSLCNKNEAMDFAERMLDREIAPENSETLQEHLRKLQKAFLRIPRPLLTLLEQYGVMYRFLSEKPPEWIKGTVGIFFNEDKKIRILQDHALLESTVVHETGHAFDFMIRKIPGHFRSKDNKKLDNLQSEAIVGENSRTARRKPYSEACFKGEKPYVTKYGMTNDQEYFAELFRTHMNVPSYNDVYPHIAPREYHHEANKTVLDCSEEHIGKPLGDVEKLVQTQESQKEKKGGEGELHRKPSPEEVAKYVNRMLDPKTEDKEGCRAKLMDALPHVPVLLLKVLARYGTRFRIEREDAGTRRSRYGVAKKNVYFTNRALPGEIVREMGNALPYAVRKVPRCKTITESLSTNVLGKKRFLDCGEFLRIHLNLPALTDAQPILRTSKNLKKQQCAAPFADKASLHRNFQGPLDVTLTPRGYWHAKDPQNLQKIDAGFHAIFGAAKEHLEQPSCLTIIREGALNCSSLPRKRQERGSASPGRSASPTSRNLAPER